MPETKIKVCGLTTTDDARTCAAMGVEMLGLNFSPRSPRCIDSVRAAEIILALRVESPVTKFIGLFVDQPLEFAQSLVDELALDGVQLHGEESPDYVAKMRAPFVVKAVRVAKDFSNQRATQYDCDAILLDTWHASQVGGTGQVFDWSVAAELRPLVRRLIVAGGLRPENVSDAIRMARPFALDVCSGVEDAPGRKSKIKLQRFVEAVKAGA